MNVVAEGQTIYLPQRQANGSISYHYANGTSVNTNPVTSEYLMSVPDGNGGVIVYARESAASGGYVLRETRSDVAGNVVEEFRARQSSLTSDIERIDLERPALTDAAFAPWVPPGPNPIVMPPDAGSTGGPTGTVVRPSYSHVFAPNADGTGIVVKTPTAPLDIGVLFDAEERLGREYNLGHISTHEYYAFQNFTIDYSLVNHTQPTQGLLPGNSGQGLQPPINNDFWNVPIGAFYDSQSAAYDNAPSIAAHTGVLLDEFRSRLSLQDLAALDTDGDGQLTYFEAPTLWLWRDVNENGRADAGEMVWLDDRDRGPIEQDEWALLTQGSPGRLWHRSTHVHLEPPSGLEPAAPAPAAALVALAAPLHLQPRRPFVSSYLPPSEYRRLRDTDNVYFLPNGQFITWAPTQVKINYNTRDAMVGTDGNDNFDARYYNAHANWFNLSLLTRFYAGGGDDVMGGSSRADTLWGGTGNDTLYGYDGNDTLYGEEGHDELVAHAGHDTLAGGLGNDRLFGGVGNDTLHGGDGDDTLVGFNPSNDGRPYLLAGETDDDQLYGGNGNDALYGGLGNDTLDGGAGNDNLLGEAGNDLLWGGAGHDELQGGDGNDRLLGEAGDDSLFGQVGNDTLWGGAGNDILVGFTASNEAQQALMPGQSDDDRILGDGGDDTLYGGTGRDELQGGQDKDVLYGEEDDDHLFGQSGDDLLYGGDGDDFLMGFTASNEAQQTLADGETDNDALYGGAGSDTLVGGWGDDWLDGGAGADVMVGGHGNDSYVVNSVNDVIYEAEGEGHDTVYASTTYLLGANLEDLHLLEGFASHGTGNARDNLIVGNSADNILDGVTGADTMVGGRGNDTYYVDHVNDAVVEQAGEGSDTVQASISYTLGENVENLILLDFSKPEKGLVDGREVLVYGYPKRNELDYMQGDAVEGFLGTCALTSIANVLTQMGRPTSESEVVTRAVDNGWTVSDASLPAWQLGGSNVQDQRALLDSYGIRNQVISGYNETGLANLLRGGRGVVLSVNAGALWNDAGYGGDGSVNHAVTLTGAVYAQDTGELVGFYLSDSGRGRVNDMTRFVDAATFRAAADVSGAYAIFTLDPVNLWEEDIDATGNALGNTLVGNRGHNLLSGLAGDDVLQGGAGDDTLDGGAGNDVLAGGTGNDLYRFGLGDGADRIEEADATPGNQDRIEFGSGIAVDALWFSRTGDHLRIDVLGSSDTLTVDRWFMDDSRQVESFRTSDGLVLVNRDVQRLVEAMAAFSPPAAGSAGLPDSQQQMLMPLLASSWQAAGHA